MTHETEIIERLARVETHSTAILERLEAIEHKLDGNGKEGIVIRLDRIEQTAKRRDKLIWASGLAILGAYASHFPAITSKLMSIFTS